MFVINTTCHVLCMRSIARCNYEWQMKESETRDSHIKHLSLASSNIWHIFHFAYSFVILVYIKCKCMDEKWKEMKLRSTRREHDDDRNERYIEVLCMYVLVLVVVLLRLFILCFTKKKGMSRLTQVATKWTLSIVTCPWS